jgi:hypothetical protein
MTINWQLQQGLFLVMLLGGPWPGRDGIFDNNNDKVDDNDEVKLMR